jgi:hypothetical protein
MMPRLACCRALPAQCSPHKSRQSPPVYPQKMRRGLANDLLMFGDDAKFVATGERRSDINAAAKRSPANSVCSIRNVRFTSIPVGRNA